MKKSIDTSRFERLVSRSERINYQSGYSRFQTIRSFEIIGSGEKKNKILVFGMYDYKTKKHAVSKPFYDVNLTFDEIEEMLNQA